MSKIIKVGAVSYLNTKPLIYGLTREPISRFIDLQLDYPKNLANQLQNRDLDIALLPVASIPEIPEARIISHYGIASDKIVASVALFSQVPLEEIQEVILDYQSKTSINLCKILFKDYWHLRPMFQSANDQFIDNIHGKTAGIIIGDRALKYRSQFKYSYDLAEAWYNLTGLPFVFAAWVSCYDPDPDFLSMFEEANALGLKHLDELIGSLDFTFYPLKKYFTENIAYTLTPERQKGLQLFLNMLSGIV